jgi:hypothetical protein
MTCRKSNTLRKPAKMLCGAFAAAIMIRSDGDAALDHGSRGQDARRMEDGVCAAW